MTLERVREVLQRFDEPQSFKVMVVAGTNGKGSSAAMLGAILDAAGYTTGVYTSPHLVRFNERIRSGGAPADDPELCRAFEYVETRRGDIPLTYFEFATLAAVRVFQCHQVRIAVMEVGMGGRLDAVNALSIDASLITNVELDHMQWLGNDREAIGSEKAHVMRAGRVSVFNGAHPPVSLLEHAFRIGTRLLMIGRDYGYRAAGDGWRWFGPRGETWSFDALPLAGEVQMQNAAGVLALLTGCGVAGVDRDTAARGLGRTRIHGRCEIVRRDPMVMIDVAHNPSAMETLKAQLAANPVSGRTLAVFGLLKDKDLEGVIRSMNDHVDAWHVATIRDERGQDARTLADAMRALVRGPVTCHDSAAHAYDNALEDAREGDRIVGFGSFHIAGDILAHMKRPS
jgi:dihydrofolate synthase/folylpolyglutamate synthase